MTKDRTKLNTITRKAFLKQSLGAAGVAALAGSGLLAFAGCNDVKADPKIEDAVSKLIDKMTLEEKVSQLRYDAPAVERLSIPKYNWWNECLHGVARAGLATVFPQAIGMAAAWNAPLMSEITSVISDEARAKHAAFVKRGIRQIYTGLTFWSPNINIVRDPRWGRGQETYGEDPYLTGRLAVHFIKGLQGEDADNLKVVGTAKHFAVYNGPEPLRHKVNVQVSPQDLYETYLPMFAMAVKEGKAASVMCAYNSVNGMPCCSNNPLLEKILRDDWKFDGYVVSDCWALNDIWKKDAHNVADGAPKAAAMALKSGTDLNCGTTYQQLGKAVKKGLIEEATLDQSLQRLFEARYRLGMIDGEEKGPHRKVPYSVVCSSKHKKLSREISRESIVLLKNDETDATGNKLLPLSDDIETVAVIGPNADDEWTMLANYHGTPDEIITPLEGIKDKAKKKNVDVIYAQGCDIADQWPTTTIIPSKFLKPSRGGGTGLYGEYFSNPNFEGTPAKTRIDDQINFTWKDDTPVTGKMADVFSVRWTGKLNAPQTGSYVLSIKAKNKFTLYVDGKKQAGAQSVHSPDEKRVSLHFKKGSYHDIKIEYLNDGTDPQAHLYWSMPDRNLEAKAMKAAKKADAIVLCMGLNSSLEGEEMPIDIAGFKGGDKTNLQLPAPQIKLMKQLHELGKPTILVLMTGSAVTFPWAEQHIPAILEAWYGGQEGGHAIADVLFGDYNPAGRLPVTFYKSIDEVPDFTDYSMKNRTYKYFKGEPLYPFGYGLSYTKFAYADLQLPDSLSKEKALEAKITVKNTGDRAGDEVVQLYVSHPDATIKHKPIRSLQAFKRLHLSAGESQQITFNLSPDQLTLVDEAGSSIQPAGRINISIGGQQPGFSGRTNAATTSVATGTVQVDS